MMSLEAILFLLLGFATNTLLTSDVLSPYFRTGGSTLTIQLLVYSGWLVITVVGWTKQPTAARRQFWVTLGFFILIVGLISVRQFRVRGDGSIPIGIHDGAVHTEEAAKVLLRGENPYVADYRGTPYAALNPRIPSGPAINVVWSHYIYPPLTFILQAGWTVVAKALGMVADVRVLYGLAWMGAVVWFIRRTNDWRQRTRLLLLTAGNPLLWLYVLAGYNDILPALGVLLSTWAVTKKQWWRSGLFFGLALVAKQSVWILVPLWAWWIWQQNKSNQKNFWRTIAGAGIAAGILMIPFIVWNAPALYDDSIRYASGAIPFSYPIAGPTALQYLLRFGWLSSGWQVLPTYWFQLFVGLPALYFLARWLRPEPTPGRWLGAAAVMMLAVLLVSRYFNNNYVTTIVLLALGSYALEHSRHEQS